MQRFLEYFPQPPARILDIGAGTGRDAAWLVGMGHMVVAVEPVKAFRDLAEAAHSDFDIVWIDDRLPSLAKVRGRSEIFDMILMTAVWMHFDPDERAEGMAVVAGLMKPGARLSLTLRHGPVPEGRRMFDVSAEETLELGARHRLHPLYNKLVDSKSAENKAAGIVWTRLVLEKF